MATCGNCSYNCCCTCQTKDNCFYCRQCRTSTGGYDQDHYRSQCVCFSCRTAWKESSITYNKHFYERYHKDEQFTNKWNSDRVCPQCNSASTHVSHTVRVPIKTDVVQWKLLEKLIITKEFSSAKPGTLAHYWYANGGLGCSLHLEDKKKKQFIAPTKLYEFDDWVTYMLKTKLN